MEMRAGTSRFDEGDFCSIERNGRRRHDATGNSVDTVVPIDDCRSDGVRTCGAYKPDAGTGVADTRAACSAAVKVVERGEIRLRGAWSRIDREYDEVVGATRRCGHIECVFRREHRR